jgi:predicted SprT family Zn-dependent metalloprotease
MPSKSLKVRAKVNREAWLGCLIELLRPTFVELQKPLPETIHVSVGFPSKGALARSKRRIGECWSGQETSADGNPHIFLHPELTEPGPESRLEDAAIDHVLLHELVHAALREENCGHRGPFRKLAEAVGLTGRKKGTGPAKMTATWATAEGARKLAKLRKRLGAYPHSALNFVPPARKKGRMLKMTCTCEEHSGRPLRVSKKNAELGALRCDLCGESFVLDGEKTVAELEQEQAEEAARAVFGDETTDEDVAREVETIRSSKRVEHAARVMARLTPAERDVVQDVLDLYAIKSNDAERRMA